MADGLGRRHQWRPDTASSRRKGIQTGRGDFREIPDCAVLRELLPPPRLMLRRETLVCDTIEEETGIANLIVWAAIIERFRRARLAKSRYYSIRRRLAASPSPATARRRTTLG